MQSTDLLSLVQGVREIHHEAEPNFGVRRMFHLLQIHTIKFEHLELFLLDIKSHSITKYDRAREFI